MAPTSRPMPRLLGGAAALALTALALLAGCGKRRTPAPDWVASAPAGTVMAVSGRAGWVIGQPGFQGLLHNVPFAEQTLDLFLKKARITPHKDTGRVSLYVLSMPKPGGDGKEIPEFIIQLGGFKDQAAVNLAVTEAFPVEGSLPLNRHELPIHVILDVNQVHIRAVADAEGRIWLGDLKSLTRLDQGFLPARHPVLKAAEWTAADAPIQGFVQAGAVLEGLAGRVPPELAQNLPKGIESLAWSVAPGDHGLHRFDLALTGSPEAILQVVPWVQRFMAAASALQGAPGAQPPELLQERNRIGLRCQLSADQINQALAKVAQPALSLGRKL